MNLGDTPFMLATYRKRAEARTIEPEHTIILILLDALKEAQGDAMHAVQALEGENAALRAKVAEMDALLTDAYHGEAKARTEAEQWKLVMIGIVDELEEARAELRIQLKAAQAEIAELQSKIAYGPFKEMLPSSAIPPGDTGEDKNETAQDASARNRRFNWDEPSR